jgi:hypothetical protein
VKVGGLNQISIVFDPQYERYIHIWHEVEHSMKDINDFAKALLPEESK